MRSVYWNNARWIFHQDALKQIRKLKVATGENEYIWQPNLQLGEPDLILGRPSLLSEFMPNTFTTGLYVGILGDFSQYWIADSLRFDVQRLVELFALENSVGYIGRIETDGMPVLPEAFVRVQLG